MKLALYTTVLLLAAASHVLHTKAAQVDPDGGYHMNVVIQDQFQPENEEQYVENIKKIVSSFSIAMKIATKTFWVKHVNILLPQTWKTDTNVGDAGTLKFEDGDIRISSAYRYPYVLNPNICHLPGQYVELPDTFFNSLNRGEYAEPRKALLNLWARLRWGVWEEHGYPGDDKYPYFYKDPSTGTWNVTGCFDVFPQGEFKAPSNNNTVCDPEADTMDPACRFIPWDNNTETRQSIMSFQQIDSVLSFCDKRLVDLPHRHNLYCAYESAMDTITNSLDMLQVDPSMVPEGALAPGFSVLKARDLPALHIILDRGTILNSDAGLVAAAMLRIASRFASWAIPTDVRYTALSVYPKDNVTSGLDTKIAWGEMATNRIDIIRELETVQLTGEEDRDFGVALQEAAFNFAEVNPISGGIVLLIKIGGAGNNTSFSRETETRQALLENKVRLFAFEIAAGDSSRFNLERVAADTNGFSYRVDKTSDINLSFESALNTVYGAFSVLPDPPVTGNMRTLFTETVTGGVKYNISIPEGATTVTFTLVHEQSFDAKSIFAGDDRTGYGAEFVVTKEYSSSADASTRYVYNGTLDISRFTKLTSLEFNYVIPSTLPQNDGYLLVTAMGDSIAEPVTVKVTTTAVNNVVDLARPANKNQPFAIFAQVSQGSVPVANAEVKCTAIQNGIRVKTITMKDDGAGLPDVESNDGVYSAIFVPGTDGFFTFEVSATAGPAGSTAASARAYLSLMPENQDFIQPDVNATNMPGGTIVSGRIATPINIMNRDRMPIAVPRITDLRISVNENDTSRFDFTFTIPTIAALDDAAADNFRIFRGPVREALLELNITAPTMPDGVEELMLDSNSTEDGVLTARYISTATENRTEFVGIVAFYGDYSSDISNLENLEEYALGGGGGGEDQDGEDGDPWLKSTAGIVTVVAIVLVVFAAAGGGFFYMKKKRSARTASGGA